MKSTRYALDQPLPADVLVGAQAGWIRYRNYPVFSVPWLRGRILFALTLVTLWATLNGVSTGLLAKDVSVGVTVASHQFVAFLFMSTAGPALATAVRHRRWPEARERIFIVASILIAIVACFFVDQWASAKVNAALSNIPSVQAATTSLDGDMVRLSSVLNMVLLLPIYGLLSGALALRAWFGEQRRWRDSMHMRELEQLRNEKQQADLTLGVLQAQVEPHFLFNTLASIRALVRQDPEQAERTLDALVHHLRATIPKLRDDQSALHSTLGQQLDICTSYLELMRLRLDGRLTWSVDVAEQDLSLPFPPLLLITLTENAVKHGIEPKPGQGHIRLVARREQTHLLVSVIDDGVGLKLGIGSGLGLANVRAQLATRYGDTASLNVSAAEPDGTRASLRIPLSLAS